MFVIQCPGKSAKKSAVRANMSQLTQSSFNAGLLEFIQSSPTPFHAVQSMAKILAAAGFTELCEADSWQLVPGERYYVTRNESSIIAFIHGTEKLLDTGIRMLGAHTDSPCLKVKPKAEVTSAGYHQLGVEVYGGVLLNTWFDRDLSIAGRVTYKKDNARANCLIDFVDPIVMIPSLAIHLDREANKNHTVNAQDHIKPIFMRTSNSAFNWHDTLKTQIQKQHSTIDNFEILDFELSLYDTQAPRLVGANNAFIASARLDNLLSCFVELQIMCNTDNQTSSLMVCNDHEEVGSSSACGADGPMLDHFLQRLIPNTEERLRVLDLSLMISADNAHGIHPNFKNKHDDQHGPLLNAGPVIKVNANQRYATNSETAGLFRLLCEKENVPVQSFVSRSDMGCGSTLGPITAAAVGVKTLDVGAPTFAMHSIRELAGSADTWSLYKVLLAFALMLDPPGRTG